MIFINPAQR